MRFFHGRRFLEFFCLALVFGLSACSPKSEPPDLGSPVPTVNVEACRNIDISMEHLTPNKIRGMVTCLNGQYGALQPYKDFLDNVSDTDLEVVLKIYNQYIWGRKGRLSKMLGVVDGLKNMGETKPMYKDIQVVIDHKVIQSALPLVGRWFSAEGSGSDVDPLVMVFVEYLTQLIDHNALSPSIVGGANMFNSARAQALAYFLSLVPQGTVLNSDGAVDLLSQTILSMMQTGAYHKFLNGLGDEQISGLLKVFDDQQATDVADLLTFLPSGASHGNKRIQRMTELIAASNSSLTCFKGSGRRYVPNVLKFMIKEGSGLSGGSMDQYYLQNVPVLLAMTRDTCDYKPAVLKNIDLMNESASNGYLAGLHAGLNLILMSNRFDEMVATTSSEHFVQIGPLLEELSLRNSVALLMDLMRKNLTQRDAQAMATALTLFTTENWSENELKSWLQNSVPPEPREILLGQLQQLPKEKRNLWGLDASLLGKESLKEAYREFKWAQINRIFIRSFENQSLKIIQKILTDVDAQQEIKVLFQKVAETFLDHRGGLGHLMGVAGRAISMSKENPFQDLLRDILVDPKLIRELLPLFIKFSIDERFLKSVEFTGKLAGNGQLEMLVDFLSDTFKAAGGPKLDPTPNESQHNPQHGNLKDTLTQYPIRKPQPPNGDFSACMKIDKTIADPTGETLYNVLKCTNAQGAAPDVAIIAEHLKSAGVLKEAADFMNALFIRSNYLGATLDQIESLWKNGYLAKFFKLFSLSAKDPHLVPYRLDPLMGSGFGKASADDFLKLQGDMLSSRVLGVGVDAALDLFSLDPVKIMKSDESYQAKINNPIQLKSQIQKFFPDLTPIQVDQLYQKARVEFQQHNNDWYFRDGVFPVYTNAQWREVLVAFVVDLMKFDALEQMLTAMAELSTHVGKNDELDMVGFIKWAANSQRVGLWWPGDSKTPVVRIMTALDQLDVLVRAGDVEIPPIVDYVGLKFQLGVVHADDLSEEMASENKLLKAGKIYAEAFLSREKVNHIKTMLDNFQTLEETAANGYMKIFKRLYIALYNATPAKYRDKQDVNNNLMHNIDKLTLLTSFSSMTLGALNAQDQGQLEAIVKAVMKMAGAIKPQDYPKVRNLVALLLQPYGTQNTLLGVTVEKFLEAYQKVEVRSALKDSLFHLAVAFNQLDLDLGPILDAASEVAKRPGIFLELVDTLIADLTEENGNTLTLGANAFRLSPAQLEGVNEFLKVLTGKQGNQYLLTSSANLMTEVYAEQPSAIKDLWRGLKSYSKDPAVKAEEPVAFMKKIIFLYSGQKGILDGLAEVLENPSDRKNAAKVLQVLGQNGDFKSLMRHLVDLIDTNKMESVLHFIFDNMGKPPTGRRNSLLERAWL